MSNIDELKKILDNREEAHGQSKRTLQSIANLWNDYLYQIGMTDLLERRDVAKMMILLKIARSVSKDTKDDLLDMAGYALLAADDHDDEMERRTSSNGEENEGSTLTPSGDGATIKPIETVSSFHIVESNPEVMRLFFGEEGEKWISAEEKTPPATEPLETVLKWDKNQKEAAHKDWTEPEDDITEPGKKTGLHDEVEEKEDSPKKVSLLINDHLIGNAEYVLMDTDEYGNSIIKIYGMSDQL